MKIIYSDSDIPNNIVKSLFLAGPSPRKKNIYDWKKEALDYLQSINYDGVVFLPVPKNKFDGKDDDPSWTYDGQIEWECRCRAIADAIVFWVPRDIKGEMPGFTTNVEFGEDLHSGKIFYGRPDTADKCNYLDKRITMLNNSYFNNLHDLLDNVVAYLGKGSYRVNGEVFVPLFIWTTPQFQSWYTNLKKSGNHLIEAKVLYNMKFSNGFVFCYILSVNIWVEQEKRFKNNEITFTRNDVSAVLAYYKDNDDIKILLVKEFRSAVNNSSGFVWELPGGSASTNIEPHKNAQHELEEEAGLYISDLSRFQYIGTRQLAPTMSTHQANVYKLELTEKEYNILLSDSLSKKTFGLVSDSEMTSLHIISVSDLKNSHVDYSTLGMIYEGIYLS